MTEDATMNEAELRQAVESMRAQIAALSGRIDGLDRGEILRGVKDGRRDKLAERHAQAFGRHAGDAVAHTYRDYHNPHVIPGMQEVRVFEAAGAGAARVVSSADGDSVWAYDSVAGFINLMLPYDTESSVIEADAANDLIHVKSAGTYIITIGGVIKMSVSKPAILSVAMVERDSISMDVSGGGLALAHTTPGEYWAPYQRFITLSRSCRMTCTQSVRLKFPYTITMTPVGSEGCGMDGFSVIVDRVE